MASSFGVHKYSHKEAGSKGKYHPSTLGSGPNMVQKEGGSPPAAQGAASGTASHTPSGVVRGDGTEPRGSAPMTKQAKIKPTGSGSGQAQPSGVRKFSGLSAPGSKHRGS